MARISALLLAAALLQMAVEVMAAEGDVRTCTLTRAIECLPDEGCAEWTIQEIDLPRFVRIDLKSKAITSLDREVKRTTKIATIDRQQDLTVLHGTEQRGWSIALGESSGELTLTASGDGEGFIVFGSCINP
ncbi:MAG TPA: hypothetical protein VJ550_08600 [Geomonas sp.]|nr:hypothetical protein [Geomonas sp.]